MSKVNEVRGKIYFADPAELTIMGYDNDIQDHALTDKHSNAKPNDDALARNIAFVGEVIQPIQCVRDGNKVIVANGRTRTRACRMANAQLEKAGKQRIRIGYTIKRGEENSSGVMISANEFQRNVSCIERAEKCQKLLTAGRTEIECAELFGVTRQAIRNWVSILSCCAKVRKAAESGLISETAAAQLASLEKSEQEDKLEKLLDSSTGKATVKKAAKLAKGERQETLFKKPTKAELEDAIKDENTPKDAKDILTWVVGKAQRPW